ncbi:hypothetical protein Z948_1265 [Sulfitobacter donghicola DSW-25 = KCTC 12864 = JCM 14565]|nr:hypothetical protein Z948_1265 [Sulfitobacter donghicola DSW-25 = KCTC 12864 = JCM 14565]
MCCDAKIVVSTCRHADKKFLANATVFEKAAPKQNPFWHCHTVSM